MTTRKLTTNEKLLIEVAISPPIRQSKWSTEAKINWQLIHRIRNMLDATGIDWRKIKKETNRIEKEMMIIKAEQLGNQ